jgi:hypothetical protein
MYKIHFQILSLPLDLDKSRNLLEPMSLTEEKNLCCLCCQSGPLRLSVTIEKQIYYLGEQIVFSVEVDNRETEKVLGSIEAKLKPFYLFGGTFQEFGKNVAHVQLAESMTPRSEQKWDNLTLNIPANITPSFDNSNCINLSYLFNVQVNIGVARELKVVFPIKISSIPPVAQQPSQPHSNVMSQLPTRDVQPPTIRLPGNSTNSAVSYTPPKHSPPIITQQPTKTLV